MSAVSKPKVCSDTHLEPEFAQRLSARCDLIMCDSPIGSREKLLKIVSGATVIVSFGYTKIDAEVLDRAGPTLTAVCLHSVGYNQVDLGACKQRNIRLSYLAHLTAGAMAEFTIGLMIATGRRFKEAMADIPRDGWSKMSLDYMSGFHLIDSTVGIVGLGNIGQELVKRLQVFSVKNILYTGPRRKPEGDALGVEYTTFDDLLRNSDFVVVTCTLNDRTRLLFNKRAFDFMKPTSIFVNVTRGAVVDQEALYEALTTNKIYAAGLDVATPEPLPRDHPLVALDNCVLLPHIGTSVFSLRKQTAHAVIDNVIAVLEGRPIPLELHF